MDFLYGTVLGRLILKIVISRPGLKIAEAWVKSGFSKPMIGRFIKKNNIDMSAYQDKEYRSFADFFARTKDIGRVDEKVNAFISPCDGLLSVCAIEDDSYFHVKGIDYTLEELIPDKEYASEFKNGLCLIFRLQATDYHHFCYVDDCEEERATLIPGKLHSVQPIALSRYPVFRINKRFYRKLRTEHFGNILQMEVGAVLVGGVRYENTKGHVRKGEEAGNFELCGSTIILMLTKEYKEKLSLIDEVKEVLDRGEECPVKIGKTIGYM